MIFKGARGPNIAHLSDDDRAALKPTDWVQALLDLNDLSHIRLDDWDCGVVPEGAVDPSRGQAPVFYLIPPDGPSTKMALLSLDERVGRSFQGGPSKRLKYLATAWSRICAIAYIMITNEIETLNVGSAGFSRYFHRILLQRRTDMDREPVGEENKD